MLALRSNIRASADVPPNLLMMSSEVINQGHTEKRKGVQETIAECVISGHNALRQMSGVLTTVELIERLEAKGVKNADIARTLHVSPSRVTEMKKGERTIKLDEAVKLVSEFGLESPPAQRVPPLPAPVARLLVRYIAEELASPVEEGRLQEISEDVRAFAEFVTDPAIRGSIEMAETFFQAMRLRRPKAG